MMEPILVVLLAGISRAHAKVSQRLAVLTQQSIRVIALLTLSIPIAMFVVARFAQWVTGKSYNLFNTSNPWYIVMEFMTYLTGPFTTFIAVLYYLIASRFFQKHMDVTSQVLFGLNALAFVGLSLFCQLRDLGERVQPKILP